MFGCMQGLSFHEEDPDFKIKWLAFQLLILEFLASSLSLETICLQGFVIFSSPFMVAL
jgi:hypothetical protein